MPPSDVERVLKPWLHGRPNSDGEWRGFCPLCEDPKTSKTPSASFQIKVGVWHCVGKCGRGGSIRTLMRQIASGRLPSQKQQSSDDNVVPIDRGNKSKRKMPSDRQIKLWTKKLLGNDMAMRVMTEKRGLTKKSIKRFNLGWDGQRFTIPIYDEHGDVVNIRRYKPNAREHKDKMLSYGKGTGEGRIDGLDTLAESDWVVLAEGEMDRRIGLQNGIPCVTHTAGAGTFKAEWSPKFKDKVVYIAYDEDQSGDAGAQKVRKALEGFAKQVYRLNLGTGIKGGDLTDYFVMGRTKSDLIQAMGEAKLWYDRDVKHDVPKKGKKVTVEESQNSAHNYPIEMTVMVAGKQEPPYIAPKKMTGTCDMGASQYKCASCFFAANNGQRTMGFDPDNKELLQVIGAGQTSLQNLYAKLMEANCTNHVVFNVDEEYSIEELAITPSVEHRTEDVEVPIHRGVFNVGSYKTPVNALARIVGQQRPRPNSQRGIIHGWHIEPVESDLDTFQMTPDLMEKLKRFRTEAGQSPLEKCVEIADDMAANVTRIYGRPMLHVGYDLVWHSLVSFPFEGKNVTKGWLECLVIGDTRTGKSETANALAKHYGAGIVKPLEGASFAGLVGGNDKMQGDHFMVKWGLIPLNDKRLVVLDEMSGLYANGNRESKGIIEEMSSIRSEGKAQISKIATAETSARTRLIWISNPLRSSQSLADSSGGSIPALQDLVRNPEDIARFDFVMAESGNDVPSSIINSKRHRRIKHRYVTTYAHQLVMWAWSRRPDQVVFADGVEEFIYAAAEDLGSRYVPDPPLIQIANARIKVCRIAVALAARTFSTDKTGELVVVKKAHVKDAVKFLDEIYGKPAMGYKAASEKRIEDRKRAEKAKDQARKYLRANRSLVETLMAVGATDFRKRDFEEFGGVDRDDVSEIIPRLLGWRLITRKSRGYMMMEPALVELLRELEAEGG
jgi:hypothetical protein